MAMAVEIPSTFYRVPYAENFIDVRRQTAFD